MKYEKEIFIPLTGIKLNGNLVIPENAAAIVVFAHGSGSSRLSPRNTSVARHLNKHHFATLLFDLLTEMEDRDFAKRFDIRLLSHRLEDVTQWLAAQHEVKDLPIGYFGASTGAAAALNAAATQHLVSVVVSRGGRPDLAMDALGSVTAPTLLIVGSLDHDVLELNREALARLTCEKKLEIVEGATHLFDEPGTMNEVTTLATAWFQKYLIPEKIAQNR